MRYAAMIVTALSLVCSSTVSANGYGDYPPDLVWSQDGDVLVAALEDRLVMWTREDSTVTVIRGEVSSPSISPEDRYAAFILDERIQYFPIDDSRFITLHPSGEKVVNLTFDPLSDPSDPVLCYTTRHLGSDLIVSALHTAERYVLSPESSDVRFGAPAISQDGNNIACVNFAMNPTWYEELYVIGSSAPEGRRARIDDTFGSWSDWHESNPIWVSGRVLIYQIGGWEEWELRFLNVASGLEKFIVDNACQPSALSGGKIIAFCRTDHFIDTSWADTWEDPTSVWAMDLESDYLTPVSPLGVWSEQPSISPDGRYIGWIEITENGETLVVRPLEEFI